jgi:hypothetical protein
MDENEKIFAEARQAGIDLDLIDTILAQPITERWRHHNAALNLMLKLETAKEELGRDKDKLTAKELRAVAAKRSTR